MIQEAPSLMAVTTPFELTVAAAVLPEDHVNPLLLALSGKTAAVKVNVLPL